MPDPIRPLFEAQREKVEEIVDDPKVTQSRPVETVTVAVLGTGDSSHLPSGTVAVTPGAHQPNVIVEVITPLVAILVRFGYTFGTALVGLVTAGITPAGSKLLYTSDFYHLVLTCASLAVPVAGLGLLKDLTTVFSGLEKKFPLASGSV